MKKILIRGIPQLMVILLTAGFCLSSAAYAQDVDDPDSTTTDTSVADTSVTDSIPDEPEPGDTLDVEDDDQDEPEAERNVLLVESEDGDAGKEVRVKIISESQYPVYGASFNVLFDNTRLLVVAAQAGKHVGDGYVLDSVDIELANANGSLNVSFTADSSAVGPLFHGEDKQLVVVTFAIDSAAAGEVPVEFSGLLFSGEGGIELQLEPVPGVVVVEVEDEDEKDESPDTLDVEDDDQDEPEAERNLLLVESEDGDAGKEVRVKIISESQYPVYGASFNVLFDNTRLLVVAAQAGKHVGDGYVLDSVDIELANANGSLNVSFTADSSAGGPLFHGEDKQLVVVTFAIDSAATGEVPVEFSGLQFSGEGGVELQLEPVPGVVVVEVEDEDEKDESPDTLDVEDADSLDVEDADSLHVEDTDSLDVEESDSLDDGDGEGTLKGDFDGNGKLGVPDMLDMLKAFNGGDAAGSLEYDLNDDGKVDVFDLLDLLLHFSGKKKGIIKNVVSDSSSNAGKNGKGVWSGVSGAGLTSAGTELAFPDGSVLNVADGFDGSSLAGVTASGGLAGELLGVVEAGLSVSAPVVLPRAFTLGQNYPNPFNPSTTIKYEISEGESVFTRLTVHNIRGQVVRTLVNSIKQAGSYQVQWDGLDDSGRKLSTGLYFYRIAAGNYTQTRKMVLLK